MVNLLAKRIVVLAEESPIRPSEVSDIDDMKDVFPPASPLAVFAVETATLTVAPPVVGHGSRSSVKGDDEWRPFPEQELSLAQYARQVVERFDFQAEVSAIRTVGDPHTRRPGIILIDPWFIADDDGRSRWSPPSGSCPGGSCHCWSWISPAILARGNSPTR